MREVDGWTRLGEAAGRVLGSVSQRLREMKKRQAQRETSAPAAVTRSGKRNCGEGVKGGHEAGPPMETGASDTRLLGEASIKGSRPAARARLMTPMTTFLPRPR